MDAQERDAGRRAADATIAKRPRIADDRAML